jgi:hypothetical protein
MVNTDASRIVASVKDAQAFRDLSSFLSPDYARYVPQSTAKQFLGISVRGEAVGSANPTSIFAFNPFNWFKSHDHFSSVKTLFARRAAKIGVQLSHMVDRVCMQWEFAALVSI